MALRLSIKTLIGIHDFKNINMDHQSYYYITIKPFIQTSQIEWYMDMKDHIQIKDEIRSKFPINNITKATKFVKQVNYSNTFQCQPFKIIFSEQTHYINEAVSFEYELDVPKNVTDIDQVSAPLMCKVTLYELPLSNKELKKDRYLFYMLICINIDLLINLWSQELTESEIYQRTYLIVQNLSFQENILELSQPASRQP